jgi:hypothetical protein
MKKAAANEKPWRKKIQRRRRAHPLNGQKKLGPKEQSK